MKDKLNLPLQSQLLIVTSLDPCAMCAGSILKGGFSALSIADDDMAGVHKNGFPTRMPKEIQQIAQTRLGVFLSPSRYSIYFITTRETVRESAASSNTPSKSLSIFEQSVEKVRALVSEQRDASATAKNDATHDVQSRLPTGIELPPYGMGSVLKMDRKTLENLLANNRACMIDSDGHPALIARNADNLSPARDSVLELIRGYTFIRNNPSKFHGISLPSPAHSSVLKLNGPELGEDILLQLGALGSFLETPRTANKFALLTYLNGDDAKIQSHVSSLPPLYTEVIGVTAGRL